MSSFRTLLWCLLLAAGGALAWGLLSLDVGEVLIRWHGQTITTTVAFLLVAWGLLWFGLWLLWTLLSLPFTAWQRLAQAQARNRLANGLIALHEGRHARAERLLEKAAEDDSMAAVARLAAREAALRRGDLLAAAAQQAALANDDPADRRARIPPRRCSRRTSRSLCWMCCSPGSTRNSCLRAACTCAAPRW